jgi:hypothetical protein
VANRRATKKQEAQTIDAVAVTPSSELRPPEDTIPTRDTKRVITKKSPSSSLPRTTTLNADPPAGGGVKAKAGESRSITQSGAPVKVASFGEIQFFVREPVNAGGGIYGGGGCVIGVLYQKIMMTFRLYNRAMEPESNYYFMRRCFIGNEVRNQRELFA